MPLSQTGNKLYYDNGVYLGDVIADVDGYYKFWPDCKGGGYWDEHILRMICLHLGKMNKEWDEQIRNDPAIGGGTDGPENNDNG